MTILELHIYGPGLGLPSIDVDCLASIALLENCCGPDSDFWHLIPSNDPTVNPFNQLPALKDGQLWIAGFRNIARYIANNLDSQLTNSKVNFNLDNQQRADTEAYLSFLESRGLPLIDLSLHVSSDNFTTVTRSTLSRIFPWPQSWTITQRLRDDARKRSEHLGLSDLDVDATREKELKQESEGLSAHIPKSLRRPKPTVSGLLGSSAEQTRFRLAAVTADFFEPLEELLGDKSWFLGEQMTVLDCFALAVFAQMRIDGLPQPWLKDSLDGKYPVLSRWTKKHTTTMYSADGVLPWAPAKEKTWLDSASGIVDAVAESLPITLLTTTMRTGDPATFMEQDDDRVEKRPRPNRSHSWSTYERKQVFHANSKRRQDLIRQTFATLVSSAGLLGWLIHMGMLSMPTFRKSPPVRRNFGEAGTFLGLR